MTSKHIWRSSTADVFQSDHCVLPWTKHLNSPVLIAEDKRTQECTDFACHDQVMASHVAITMSHVATCNCVATCVINHLRACQKYNTLQLINKDQQEEHSRIQHVPKSTQQLNEILWKYRMPQYHETNYTRRGNNWCVSTRVRCNVPYWLYRSPPTVYFLPYSSHHVSVLHCVAPQSCCS
jgi:hypothetical protein